MAFETVHGADAILKRMLGQFVFVVGTTSESEVREGKMLLIGTVSDANGGLHYTAVDISESKFPFGLIEQVMRQMRDRNKLNTEQERVPMKAVDKARYDELRASNIKIKTPSNGVDMRSEDEKELAKLSARLRQRKYRANKKAAAQLSVPQPTVMPPTFGDPTPLRFEVLSADNQQAPPLFPTVIGMPPLIVEEEAPSWPRFEVPDYVDANWIFK